jgi:hypothetical protein
MTRERAAFRFRREPNMELRRTVWRWYFRWSETLASFQNREPVQVMFRFSIESWELDKFPGPSSRKSPGGSKH